MNIPIPPIGGVKLLTLVKTRKQLERGLGDLNAWVDEESYRIVDPYNWKLSYCWGWPTRPVFKGEAKVDGKRTSIHRMVACGGDLRKVQGLFVVPIDGNPLHAWRDNLRIVTAEERDQDRAAKAKQRGKLNEEQQRKLDSEVARSGLSRWQVLGKLIDEHLAIGD